MSATIAQKKKQIEIVIVHVLFLPRLNLTKMYYNNVFWYSHRNVGLEWETAAVVGRTMNYHLDYTFFLVFFVN